MKTELLANRRKLYEALEKSDVEALDQIERENFTVVNGSKSITKTQQLNSLREHSTYGEIRSKEQTRRSFLRLHSGAAVFFSINWIANETNIAEFLVENWTYLRGDWQLAFMQVEQIINDNEKVFKLLAEFVSEYEEVS
ncbi:hypothetical protein BGP77_06590 [Saccharospirillum sp. MSK14-1]|uniref:hypothetical protein n=1 Tax=Saccharospirillum sp. MSK14-1 TaxID=1897632 RepID=UPI000D33CF1B|nr:hypothetical protein [Saccharospirillum sp. MSK14-1]PTY36947.1 hypothetical protein BGP77_06590 [Saccharospirillum sp. MSK14-1]